jgi:hypothetical protein
MHGGALIMAASGMFDAGQVLHYLKQHRAGRVPHDRHGISGAGYDWPIPDRSCASRRERIQPGSRTRLAAAKPESKKTVLIVFLKIAAYDRANFQGRVRALSEPDAFQEIERLSTDDRFDDKRGFLCGVLITTVHY